MPKDQYYEVESVLKGMRDFLQATFVAAGYSASSEQGYTITTLFDLHIDNIRWAKEMGDQFSRDQTAFMMKEFKDAMQLMSRLATEAADRSPSPVEVAYTYVLPFGCPYEVNTAARRNLAAPLRSLRRAFPSLLPCTTPRVLDGVRAAKGAPPPKPAPSAKAGAQAAASGGQPRSNIKPGARGSAAKPKAASTPRSGGARGVHARDDDAPGSKIHLLRPT